MIVGRVLRHPNTRSLLRSFILTSYAAASSLASRCTSFVPIFSSPPSFNDNRIASYFGVAYFNYPQTERCWFSSQALTDPPEGVGLVDVPLAQTGEGIAECELLKWFVKEGDEVEEFQQLCEVQSDKATIEITSRYKGKVAEIVYSPGDIVKVGETLLKMVVEGSQIPDTATAESKSTGSSDSELHLNAWGSDLRHQNSRTVLSTPAVRNFAKQHGININDVEGTGKDGRVLEEDVLRYAYQKGIVTDASAAMGSKVLQTESAHEQGYVGVAANYTDETIPLRGFQRTMVKTMTMVARVPHFHYVEEITCDSLVELKASFQNHNTDPNVKHTFLPLLIKTLSMALRKYPSMNSCFNEESMEMVIKGTHNIGVAIATPYGLVVPNIKKVQSLSLMEITKELSRLQKSAASNKLSPEDVSGGTITLSNIGAIGGKFGSPLVNLPEVAIVALGRIQKVAQVSDNGDVYPASIMTVNIGADHRVLDGATVARFCSEWKQLIENPKLLMLHMR